VSADKGYGSLSTTDAITRVGATPFIAFKGNATGGIGGTWEKMFHYFQFKREEFLQHYHKRSNVESTFSMMKRKFGDSLRSKTDVAMVNETLCKVLCHNLVVLIHEMYELGIDPVFWNKPSVNLLSQRTRLIFRGVVFRKPSEFAFDYLVTPLSLFQSSQGLENRWFGSR
jgi:hypothetical protein